MFVAWCLVFGVLICGSLVVVSIVACLFCVLCVLCARGVRLLLFVVCGFSLVRCSLLVVCCVVVW